MGALGFISHVSSCDGPPTSINMMQRVGWRSNLIKAGDQIKVVAAPLLSGEPVGLGLEVTLADGSVRDLPVPAAGSFKRTPEAQ